VNLHARRRVVSDWVRGALWVLPTASVLVFLLAGAVLSRVEVEEASPLAALAFQGTAEDARSLLIVVSSTMITVTGLVFALTIVALQIASGQYSPRLLRNFMRDRGTQLVLSIFVGAFAYATAGLYTVGVQASGEEAFVPRLAVSGSLALALASVGVLIYFIHHLAHSIQIDTIMSQVEREAVSVIDDVYPHQPRYREPEERCPEPPMEAVGLPAGRSGYVQAVDPDPLVRAAVRHDLMIVLAKQVGDHVVAGTPIAWAWRRSAGQPPPGAGSLREVVASAVQVGLSGPWCRTSASASAGWSTSPTRRCRRPSTTPTPASRRSSTCRSCCAAWPACAWATGPSTTPRGSCGWPFPAPTSPTTCGSGPPRSAATGPPSRP